MPVTQTKIIFKHGATEPTGSNFATVGEPLWHQDTGNNGDLGHLYVTNGTNNPTLIGPIEATQYIHPTVTVVAGDPQIKVDSSDADTTGIIIDAEAGYAIGGIIVNNTGHITAVKSVELPASSVTGVEDGTYWTSITINGVQRQIPTGSGQTTGRNDEIYAHTASGETSAVLSTDPTYGTSPRAGVQTVTFKHTAQDQGDGSFATFIAGSPSNGNIDVTMSITVIDGGTW